MVNVVSTVKGGIALLVYMTPNTDRKPQDMAGRVSREIGFKGTQTLYYAQQQANRIDLPLNTLITINFSHTTIPAWEAVSAFGRWRTNHFNKWARRPQKGKGKPVEPTYAYWFENKRESEVFDEIGEGLPHNVHVQMYAHVPAERIFDLRGRVFEWLDFIAGDMSAAEAIKVSYVATDNGVMKYGRKGAGKAAAERYGASDVRSPQGAIVGKRTGTSTNLGPTARRALDKELGIVRKMPSKRKKVDYF